jgi:hypothetical protein
MGLSDNASLYFRKLIKGLRPGTNLYDSKEWMETNTDPKYAIDVGVLVVSAEKMIYEEEIPGGWIRNAQHIRKITGENLGYLASLYNLFHDEGSHFFSIC